jgi:hypothetical protein
MRFDSQSLFLIGAESQRPLAPIRNRPYGSAILLCLLHAVVIRVVEGDRSGTRYAMMVEVLVDLTKMATIIVVTTIIFGHSRSGESHQHNHHHCDYSKN